MNIQDIQKEEYKKVREIIVSHIETISAQYTELSSTQIGDNVVNIQYDKEAKTFTVLDNIDGVPQKFSGPSFETVFTVWQSFISRFEQKKEKEVTALKKEMDKLDDFISNIETALTITIGFSASGFEEPIIQYHILKKYDVVKKILAESSLIGQVV